MEVLEAGLVREQKGGVRETVPCPALGPAQHPE